MKARQKRLLLVLLGVVGVAGASALIITALRGNLNYYLTPTKVMAGEVKQGELFRLGGMVREGSLKREEGNLEVEFVLTDYKSDITVYYSGILPDLFKEKQSAVTKGKLDSSGKFIAEEVLAKHDPSYMPKEVKDSLDMDSVNKANDAKNAQMEAMGAMKTKADKFGTINSDGSVTKPTSTEPASTKQANEAK